MGCWSLPYQTSSKSKKFYRCMQKNWIAKVKISEDGHYYIWEASDLYDLFGEDGLYDSLDAMAQRGKDFDIRPFVRRRLTLFMKSLEMSLHLPAPIKDLNLIRLALGMEELPKTPKLLPFQRIPAKILELLNEAKIFTTHSMISNGKLSTSEKKKIYRPIIKGTKNQYVLRLNFEKNPNMNSIKKVLKSIPTLSFYRDFSTLYISYNLKHNKNIDLESERTSFNLIFKNDKSHKYWIGKIQNKKLITKYGRVGSIGKESVKLCLSKEDALLELQKLAKSKLKKGYISC